MMLPYPFNKYGWYDRVEIPIKNFFWKLSAFRSLLVYPWDCCDLHEVVFSRFAFFCRNYPTFFIDQMAAEERGLAYDAKHFPNDSHFDIELVYTKVEKLKRLAEIQEYVLYTREYNKAALEYLEKKFFESFVMGTEPYDKHLHEIVFRHNFYLYVNFWFERGEVRYIISEEGAERSEKSFNPLDLEDAMDSLDKEYAKELIDLKNLIWD